MREVGQEPYTRALPAGGLQLVAGAILGWRYIWPVHHYPAHGREENSNTNKEALFSLTGPSVACWAKHLGSLLLFPEEKN